MTQMRQLQKKAKNRPAKLSSSDEGLGPSPPRGAAPSRCVVIIATIEMMRSSRSSP